VHLPDDAEPLAVALISARVFIGEAESRLYQAEQAFDAGRLDDAVEYARKALELDALVPAPLLARMHARLTLFTASQGDLQAAEEHGRESVHRYEELRFFPDDLAAALDNLGTVLAHRGDFTKALALWERALDIKLDHLPVDQVAGLQYRAAPHSGTPTPTPASAPQLPPTTPFCPLLHPPRDQLATALMEAAAASARTTTSVTSGPSGRDSGIRSV
jgi:tetratricopeptide (TPR) repeat protein